MTTVFAHGYALLIGVDANSVPEWALPDVAKDVDGLATVLLHPQRCAYPPEHVRVLKGAAATRQGILDSLEWLQAQVTADPSANATAVIYYSGHGWRDAEASPPAYYLIPYDVRRNKLRATALRAEDLAEAIEAVQPQRLLVIFDCCHAGGLGVKDVSPALARFEPAALPPELLLRAGAAGALAPGAKGIDQLAQLATGSGRAVLSSSTGVQQSYIRRDRAMSIFTYHLVAALTGHAQPQDGAPEVLVSDVLSYVYRQVPQSARAEAGANQQPDGRITGNFAVALVLGGKGLAKGELPPDPLVLAPAAPASSINTGGGAYIGGSFNMSGGEFTGRDTIVHGDVVHGDKVGGDKVGGDKISGDK